MISALKLRGLWPGAESAGGYKGNNTFGEERNPATAEKKRNKNRGQGGCRPDAEGGNRGATAQSGITLAELAHAKGIPWKTSKPGEWLRPNSGAYRLYESRGRGGGGALSTQPHRGAALLLAEG